eukprot:360265-Chlamydomonas_euryale.AAC.4
MLQDRRCHRATAVVAMWRLSMCILKVSARVHTPQVQHSGTRRRSSIREVFCILRNVGSPAPEACFSTTRACVCACVRWGRRACGRAEPGVGEGVRVRARAPCVRSQVCACVSACARALGKARMRARGARCEGRRARARARTRACGTNLTARAPTLGQQPPALQHNTLRGRCEGVVHVNL